MKVRVVYQSPAGGVKESEPYEVRDDVHFRTIPPAPRGKFDPGAMGPGVVWIEEVADELVTRSPKWTPEKRAKRIVKIESGRPNSVILEATDGEQCFHTTVGVGESAKMSAAFLRQLIAAAILADRRGTHPTKPPEVKP